MKKEVIRMEIKRIKEIVDFIYDLKSEEKKLLNQLLNVSNGVTAITTTSSKGGWVTATPPRRAPHWTKDEIKILVDMKRAKTRSEKIAETLNRTLPSINTKWSTIRKNYI